MKELQQPISRSKLTVIGSVLFLLLMIVGLLSSFSGPISILEESGSQFWQNYIWQGRVTRIIAAGLAGGGLSLAGLALQALLRNPLAEPYILGISSGAAVGVIIGLSISIHFALPAFITTPTLAFVGAVTTCIVVYIIAQKRGHIDPYSLILSGVMVNSINVAIIMSVYLFIDPHTLVNFVGWSIGQVPDVVSQPHLYLCGVCILGASLWILLRGAAFNTLGLGDVVAVTSGVPVKRLRIETLVMSGWITACSVSLVGPIGFVGLFIPHICRLLFGPDHRKLAIVSGLVGAIFLIASDMLCRAMGTLLNLGRFPVGIVTVFIGGPTFIWLLRNRYKASISL